MLSVSKATYAGGYSIHLCFNNGRDGVANLEETIVNDDRAIFSKLAKISNFKKFRVAHSTVIWSDNLDLAPEYLYYLAFKDDVGLREQFNAWGY